MSKCTAPKIRAYAVTEEDENTGGIVFARHAIVALKQGASEHCNTDWEFCRAVRAPWADEYATTNAIPQSAAIAHGWNFECSGCGARVDEDWLADNDLRCEDVQGKMSGPAYCCRACQLDHDERKARAKAAERRGLDALRDHLKRRFPAATETTSYGSAWEKDGCAFFVEGSVNFTFPGQKVGDAVLSMRRGYMDCQRIGPVKPELRCCHGDKEAFNAWASAQKTEPPR